MESNYKPIVYVLIGVPGSGKSTWVESQPAAKECAYVSTDKWIEGAAKEGNTTYSKIFKEFMPQAVMMMAKDVEDARQLQRNIVWDQTSTTVLSRKRKFMMLPEYHKVAVVFPTPPIEELKRRLESRPGKEIPWEVIQDFIDKFEPPTKEEGFDEIVYIDE